MPRNWGVNSKAAEARAKEVEKKNAVAEKKKQEAEDAYWKDDDKHVQKKLDRKEEKQRKHDEEVRRREETRKLLEMESEQLKSSKPQSAVQSRPTRAQIDAARETAELEEKTRLGLIDQKPQTRLQSTVNQPNESNNSDTTSRIPKKKDDAGDKESEDDLPPIEENINKILSLNEGDGSARSVDQALVLLGDDEAGDAHPERRMKKAHLEFEKTMMAKLKLEYPNMRHSQLKEMIWREWQRAPQNPLNMATKTTREKATSD